MIYQCIEIIFQIINLLLFVRVVLSWIPNPPSHPIIMGIYQFTDPILKPFQNIIPPYKIGIDLSPLFAFIALSIAKKLLLMLL